MKTTAQRRRDRRDLLDNLLSRALRGNLTTAEAALMVESVREEQRAYDQTRRSLGETGTAYGKHRAAADDAIRELEQRALDAEEQLTAYRSVLGPRPLDRIRAAEQHAAQAEELLAAAHQCSNDAEAARAAAEERARKAERAAALLAGSHRRAEAAEDRLARIRDMADAWEQRLPATIRTATAAEAVRNAANGDDKPVMFSMALTAGAGTIEFAEQERARFERLYTRETVRAEQAEHRARRYRTAWMACRRDRKADRAAMAAELPFIEAGHKALAAEAATWWRCHICRVLTDTDPCHICDTDRPAPDDAPDDAPEVITDRATIRAALDEAEPNRGECCDCPHEMEA